MDPTARRTDGVRETPRIARGDRRGGGVFAIGLFAAVTAASCGATSWTSPPAGRYAQANDVVRTFAGCGGAIAGDWRLRGMWATDLGGHFGMLPHKRDREACNVSGWAELVGGAAGLSFGRDGSVRGELSGTMELHATVSKSCLEGGETCAALVRSYSIHPPDWTSRDGGDVCVLEKQERFGLLDDERTYSVASDALILPGTFGDRVYPYCVSGGQLALRLSARGLVAIVVLDRSSLPVPVAPQDNVDPL